jgi:hypothetical protein
MKFLVLSSVARHAGEIPYFITFYEQIITSV